MGLLCFLFGHKPFYDRFNNMVRGRHYDHIGDCTTIELSNVCCRCDEEYVDRKFRVDNFILIKIMEDAGYDLTRPKSSYHDFAYQTKRKRGEFWTDMRYNYDKMVKRNQNRIIRENKKRNEARALARMKREQESLPFVLHPDLKSQSKN